MKQGTCKLAVTVLLFGAVAAGAQSATEPLSGIPLAAGFKRSPDPVESYKYCGNSARVALYVGDGSSDQAHEKAWFAHATPRGRVCLGWRRHDVCYCTVN